MNEAETRAEHIAPTLTAAGWGVIETMPNLKDPLELLLRVVIAGLETMKLVNILTPLPLEPP
jgi:hypothetical protein